MKGGGGGQTLIYMYYTVLYFLSRLFLEKIKTKKTRGLEMCVHARERVKNVSVGVKLKSRNR